MGIGDTLTRLGSTRAKAFAVLAGFLAVGLVAALLVRGGDFAAEAGGCDDGVDVAIAVDPSIAPAVEKVIEQADIEVDGACVDPDIRSASSAAVQARLTADAPDPQRPDLWIPDSSVWLALADDEHADRKSVAKSPVVLATEEKTATAAGWTQQRAPRWSKVFGGTGKVGASAPSKQTSTMFVQAAIDRIGLAKAKREQASVAMARTAIEPGAKSFEHLPGGRAKPSVAAFPASEQAVLEHNEKARGKVVAAYPDERTPWLDYPATILDSPDAMQVKASNAVRDALLSERGQRVLTDQGFRTAAGELDGKAAADSRVQSDAGRPAENPSDVEATRLLQHWATSSQSARMLVAVDTTGSMRKQVPGTGLNRAQATLKTVADGLNLLRDESVLTIWEFATDAAGTKQPYKEIVPARTVRDHLDAGLPDRIVNLVARPQGATPLYDTTLAAVQEARKHWDPESLNLVVVMTDGEGSFDSGITREEMLDGLRKSMSKTKPIGLIFIGLGTGGDGAGDLKRIAKDAGGQALLTPDIRQARELYFEALRGLAEPK